MNVKRLLHTPLGQFFVSILLGLGLAALFRRTCMSKNCIEFKGPILSEVEGKIYQHGEKCYKYTFDPAKCDSMKKTVEIESSMGLPQSIF